MYIENNNNKYRCWWLWYFTIFVESVLIFQLESPYFKLLLFNSLKYKKKQSFNFYIANSYEWNIKISLVWFDTQLFFFFSWNLFSYFINKFYEKLKKQNGCQIRLIIFQFFTHRCKKFEKTNYFNKSQNGRFQKKCKTVKSRLFLIVKTNLVRNTQKSAKLLKMRRFAYERRDRKALRWSIVFDQ